MIRKTIMTVATAAVISAGTLGATANTASAKVNVDVHIGGGGFVFGHGGHGHGWGHYNPCRKYWKKYKWTGKKRFLRKYRRCMRWYY